MKYTTRQDIITDIVIVTPSPRGRGVVGYMSYDYFIGNVTESWGDGHTRHVYEL